MKTAIESILLSRKTALLYRNSGVGQAASIANAVMLAYLMAGVFNIAGAAWWLALALMVALGRVALARAYRRDVQRDGRASLWCRRSALGAAASGAVWGSAAVLFMAGQDDVPRLFTAFVLAGMVAGAVPLPINAGSSANCSSLNPVPRKPMR